MTQTKKNRPAVGNVGLPKHLELFGKNSSFEPDSCWGALVHPHPSSYQPLPSHQPPTPKDQPPKSNAHLLHSTPSSVISDIVLASHPAPAPQPPTSPHKFSIVFQLQVVWQVSITWCYSIFSNYFSQGTFQLAHLILISADQASFAAKRKSLLSLLFNAFHIDMYLEPGAWIYDGSR